MNLKDIIAAKPSATAQRQREHARQRLQERYRLTLSVEVWRQLSAQLVKRLQAGEWEFVQRKGRNSTLWIVALLGKQCLAIYDSSTKEISTFLPYHRLKQIRAEQNRQQRKQQAEERRIEIERIEQARRAMLEYLNPDPSFEGVGDADEDAYS